jgi:hypothetical protein
MTLHDHHLLAEVGRPKCGGVASRARTQHQNLGAPVRLGKLARRGELVRGHDTRGVDELGLRLAAAGGADFVRAAHSRRFRMSERTVLRRVVKRTASAPLITR